MIIILMYSLQVMNPFRTGKLVLFQVTYSRSWHFFEIFFFIILGIFGVGYKFPLFFWKDPDFYPTGTLWRIHGQV